jgi:hypothetical protein
MEVSPSLELALEMDSDFSGASSVSPPLLGLPLALGLLVLALPLVDRGGDDGGVDTLTGFDLSRNVMDIGGGGGARRDATTEAAVVSSGARIARVRSIHWRVEPAAGNDGRPPLRFFVAFSS